MITGAWAIVGAVAGFAIWTGAVFTAGNKVGASGVDKANLAWSSKLSAANAQLKTATDLAAQMQTERDEARSAKSKSEDKARRDMACAIQAQRTAFAAEDPCRKCRLPASRYWLRDGSPRADRAGARSAQGRVAPPDDPPTTCDVPPPQEAQ